MVWAFCCTCQLLFKGKSNKRPGSFKEKPRLQQGCLCCIQSTLAYCTSDPNIAPLIHMTEVYCHWHTHKNKHIITNQFVIFIPHIILEAEMNRHNCLICTINGIEWNGVNLSGVLHSTLPHNQLNGLVKTQIIKEY